MRRVIEKLLVKLFQDTISEYMHQVEQTVIWELIKMRAKEFSIQYSQSRKKKKNSDIRKLETQINVLNKRIQYCNSEEVITKTITERKYLEKQLDALY